MNYKTNNEANNNITRLSINNIINREKSGIVDTTLNIDGVPGYYNTVDNYRPFTIFGHKGEFLS